MEDPDRFVIRYININHSYVAIRLVQGSPVSIPAQNTKFEKVCRLAGGAKSFEHMADCAAPSLHSYCRGSGTKCTITPSKFQRTSLLIHARQVHHEPRYLHKITRSKMEHRSQANRMVSTSLAVVATIAGLIFTYVALSNSHSVSMRAFAAGYGDSNAISSSSSPVAQMAARHGRRRLMDEVDDLKEKDQGTVHSQCARGNPKDLKERPLLIFKYSRTGSTWLAWTGNTVKLASGKNMVWTHEATKCDKDRDETTKTATAAGTVEWFKEYFGHETDGKLINEPNRHVPRSEGGMQSECLQNAGEDPDNIGVTIATLNPHESHVETPDLSDEEWGDIFGADPNLAMGVLVRTNSVKRAISAIASHKQLALCGRKKLTGGEDCIKNLPKTINLNVTELWSKIHESEMKRAIVTEAAGELANKFGDGRIFCLSYESMQQDIVGEMRDLGEFLGSPIDEESLQKLSEESVSYKRGSDDLSEYIENYDEVYESLSKNPCLLEQLEEDEPKNFPLCGVYTGDEEEESQ